MLIQITMNPKFI